MHDRQLTELFRTLETGAELAGPEPQFADALFGRLRAEARSTRWSRPMVLLVAALLAAAALAVGIAIGSGLIDLPSADEQLLPVHGLDCPPADVSSPPAGAALMFEVGAGGPGGSRLTIYEDGLLLIGRPYPDAYTNPFPALAAGGSEHSAQRLTPTGVELVRNAVAESGLVARGCHLDLLADNPLRGISVRSVDGAVAQTDWGRYGGFLRVMTLNEQAAAATLVARLEDLDGWLPPEAWARTAPETYEDELWLVATERVPAEQSYSLGLDATAIARATLARQVVLLDGSTPLTFGEPWSEPASELGNGEVQDGRDGRCAVVDLADAREVYLSLEAAPGSFYNGSWWFADGGDWIGVRMRALAPPDRECSPRVIGIFDPSAPWPPAQPEPGGPSLAVDPCSLLPEDLVSDALGFEPPYRMAAQREDNFHGNSSYLTCIYVDDGSDPTSGWGNSLTVAVRRVATTAAQAPELAHMWLGEGFDDTISGAPVWLNECMTSSRLFSDIYCRAVVAVYAEPYFVLIVADSSSVQDDIAVSNGEEVARSLIPLLLANLSQSEGPP